MKKCSLKTLSHISLFIFIALFSITFVFNNLFYCAQNANSDENTVDILAEAAILIDLDRGQVLYEKSANKQFYDPMLPKLMTSLLTIELADIESKVTASINAAEAMGDDVVIEAGQQYSIKDMIAASVLTSSHNTTIALAEFIEPDSEKFVSRMNAKASSLNMKNTMFANSYGSYDSNQYTTARDIVTFLRYALSVEDFKTFFTTQIHYTQSPLKGFITSKNRMFWNYDYTRGGKIARISNDKMSAITLAVKNDRNLLSVVLNSPASGNRYIDDSTNLLNYGFDNFRKGKLVSKGEVLREIEIKGHKLNLISTSDIYYTYPNGDAYIENIESNITKDFDGTINKGDFLGTLRYILKDGTVIDVPLQAEKNIYLNNQILSKLIEQIKENKDLYRLVLILIYLEAFLIFLYIIRGVFRIARKLRNK